MDVAINRFLVRSGGAALLAVACGDSGSRESPWADSSLATTVGDTADSEAGDGESEGSSSEGDASDTSAAASSSGGEAPVLYDDIARVNRPPGIIDEGSGIWTLTEPALAEIGHAFFADHPDDYDFLAIYTEGDLIEFFAFAHAVQDGIGGIGFGVGDSGISPVPYGSAGRLQQILMMNTPALYSDPSDASILVHETTHRWSAFIELQGTPEPGWLLDDSWAHWNIHVNTGGPSATGYGDLVDLGGGGFRFTVQYPLQLSPLELYLAGFIPPGEVPPMFYVIDPYGYDPAVPPFGDAWARTSYGVDATFSGTRVDFTIDDVIAANGARTPAFGDAQTEFRFAFVLVCEDASACDPAALAGVEAQRTAFEDQLGTATGGRASADATL